MAVFTQEVLLAGNWPVLQVLTEEGPCDCLNKIVIHDNIKNRRKNLQYRYGPYQDRKVGSTSSCGPGNRIQFQNEANFCQPFFSNGYKLPFFLRRNLTHLRNLATASS